MREKTLENAGNALSAEKEQSRTAELLSGGHDGRLQSTHSSMRASGVETVIVVRESPPWGVGGQRAHIRTKQYIKMYICIIWREPGRRAPGNFLSQGKLSGEEEERGKKEREGGGRN